MFQTGAFLSYVLVVTFTPGPNNILSMVNASRDGYRKTLGFLAGIFTGFVALMLLCGFFNLVLFGVMPKITIVMQIVGALYMSYLAYKVAKSSGPKDEDSSSGDSGKNVNSFFTGMTMQFVNPKVVLYGITVMANFIIPFYKSGAWLLLFSVFLAFTAFIATSCWALFGSLFNRFLSRYSRPFNIAMSLLLLYSAYSISGLSHLV